MWGLDEDRLGTALTEYSSTFAASAELHRRGHPYFPNGVAQSGRDAKPFPLFIQACSGAEITTVDGVSLIDFWQGHFANVFGHNPSHLAELLNSNDGRPSTQLGMNIELEQIVAAKLTAATATEQILFFSTGAQATMAAIMIGIGSSGRSLTLKFDGGWHGVHPWSLKGIRSSQATDDPFEARGVPQGWSSALMTAPYNDCQALADVFAARGDEIGVVVVELVLGNAGMQPAELEFVHLLRELTAHYGTVLVIDEIVTGFRCRPGPFANFYGVSADIGVYGKAIAGGMPFAAVTGSTEMLACVSKLVDRPVMADLGTFTSHPACLRAVDATIDRLTRVSDREFDDLSRRATQLRRALTDLFAKSGVPAGVSGEPTSTEVPQFPIMTVRFDVADHGVEGNPMSRHWDLPPTALAWRDSYLRALLALRGAFVWQGAGVLTLAHDDSHVAGLIASYQALCDLVVDSQEPG